MVRIFRWNRDKSRDYRETYAEKVKPNEPLKSRIDYAVNQIRNQISKLDSCSVRLSEKAEKIFIKIVQLLKKKDKQHAAMFANELAEIKKMNNMVTQSKLALEQITLRLETVQNLGDLVINLNPAINVIKSIKPGLSRVVPEAESEISEISNLLGDLLTDVGHVSGWQNNFETLSEDAEKILEEASLVAENRTRERFPDIPTILPNKSKKILETA